jgi:6-phosphogluconate dehydrogenase
VRGFSDLKEFIGSLERPRKVLMMVQAGKAVDMSIEKLVEYLESGDILIDGGNEWYENSQRRAAAIHERGIQYMAMGVSGGEEGARHGPSLMPGGPLEAYSALEPMLLKIAAQADGEPCVTYIGPGGAGNYVKMVHNGIEYGDMELIAEAYDLMKRAGGLTNEELADVFQEWNQGELSSFLIEITGRILRVRDHESASEEKGEDGGPVMLVDRVVDKSGSKGTGKMTVQEAAERGIAASTIVAALDSRYMTSLKEERVIASKVFKGPSPPATPSPSSADKAELVKKVRSALYASKVCSYAQGMNILRRASDDFGWGLDLGAIAAIWKGGCIIRAAFLDRIRNAYKRDPKLSNLVMDTEFAKELQERESAWREVVILGVQRGIPLPSFSASLAYFDMYRSAKLPANLIQAQRDLFGAHTFIRTDKEGVFHDAWDPSL